MGAGPQKAVRALNYLFEVFFIARSASPACASDVYGKKSKNLRKPANVGDRRFPRPKGCLPRGWYHFTTGYTTTPDLWLTCDLFVGKVSAMGQPTRSSQPSVPSDEYEYPYGSGDH